MEDFRDASNQTIVFNGIHAIPSNLTDDRLTELGLRIYDVENRAANDDRARLRFAIDMNMPDDLKWAVATMDDHRKEAEAKVRELRRRLEDAERLHADHWHEMRRYRTACFLRRLGWALGLVRIETKGRW